MAASKSKNEMLVMVLIDLGELCKKLAKNSAVPPDVREQARQFGEEYDSLLPYRGKGSGLQHYQGEVLIQRIARFLPRVLDVDAHPRAVGE
jgi:hypothetical protein